MKMIRISIALVTRNRPKSLRRTLESLRKQSLQPFEVVVSDDSSCDQAKADSLNIAKEFGCRYIEGPMRGLYANRNHVALACNGTHIRSMDDDHTFPENHFHEVQDWTERYPVDVLTIGEYLPDEEPCPFTPPGIPAQLHPRGKSTPPPSLSGYYGISCGGSVYPRKIFEIGYRFEESFLFGSSYLEFGSLLKSKGQKMRFIDTTYLIHHLEHADLRRPHIVAPSLICSLLCHSFHYQPSLENQFKTLIKLAIFAITRNAKFPKEFRKGYRAFKRRKGQTEILPRLDMN